MGYGSFLAYGCTISSCVAGVMSFSLHARVWPAAALADSALWLRLVPRSSSKQSPWVVIRCTCMALDRRHACCPSPGLSMVTSSAITTLQWESDGALSRDDRDWILARLCDGDPHGRALLLFHSVQGLRSRPTTRQRAAKTTNEWRV